MKLMMKRLLVILLAAVIFSCSLFDFNSSNSATAESTASRAVAGQYNVPPSKLPPKTSAGEIVPIEQTPMFVTFGWDDNAYADGMDWSVNMVAGKTNHAGSGQAATYDGAPLSFTYFHIGSNKNFQGAVDSWNRAFDAGHEVGNHTYSHNGSTSNSKAAWDNAIDQCNDVLTAPRPQGMGVTIADIKGFRTPRLEYNDALFNSLFGRDMYDCSINEGFEYDQDGTNFFWPYTLDEGSPGHDIYVEWGMKQPISSRPGLWELPVYAVITPPEIRQQLIGRVGVGQNDYFDPTTGKITGFDYNLWYTYKMSKEEMLATLKHTLDLRLQGNRVPMMLGTHTDMYSSSYNHAMASTLADRRAAMEEFIAYAQTKSVVRVVSMNQILDWMKNPVPLVNTITHTVTVNAGSNGSVEPGGSTTVVDCGTATFTFKPDAGYMVDTVIATGAPFKASKTSVTVGPVEANTTLDVTFIPIPAGEPFQGTYYWTYNPEHEPVDMTTPMVDMLDLDNKVLATVPEALAKRIAMEGSGFLPDGRLLNLNNDFDWPQSRFFIVDQSVAPYGYNATGQPLVPYRSLAVDNTVIPTGTDVYVKEFDGLRVPDGKGGYFIHDGWWVASDTSHSFSGFQIDFFVVTQPNYVEINELLNNLAVFETYGEFNQVQSYTIAATSNKQGALWPSGDIRVATGKGEKFYMFPGEGNKVKQVLVDGASYPFDAATNTFMIENVTTNKTVYVEVETPQKTVTTSVINGTITPSVTVDPGTNVTIEFAPVPSTYVLDYVMINGVIDNSVTSPYVINSISADQTIEVKFKDPNVQTYTIATSKTGNGTIDASVTVEQGQNAVINFVADPGNYVESVLVNGSLVDPTPQGSYEFTGVAANQTILVNFALSPTPLTAVYTKGTDWGTGFGANVVITNNGTEPVNGWTVTMTFSGNQSISGWNGSFSQVGNVVTVTNTSWNGTIQPGGTVSFGFNGSYSGDNFDPSITVE